MVLDVFLAKSSRHFFLKLKRDSVSFEQMCAHYLTQLEALTLKQFREKSLAFVMVVVLSFIKTLASLVPMFYCNASGITFSVIKCSC